MLFELNKKFVYLKLMDHQNSTELFIMVEK